jgi:hypothetical protein
MRFALQRRSFTHTIRRSNATLGRIIEITRFLLFLNLLEHVLEHEIVSNLTRRRMRAADGAWGRVFSFKIVLYWSILLSLLKVLRHTCFVLLENILSLLTIYCHHDINNFNSVLPPTAYLVILRDHVLQAVEAEGVAALENLGSTRLVLRVRVEAHDAVHFRGGYWDIIVTKDLSRVKDL